MLSSVIVTSRSVSVCNCSQEKSLAKLLTEAIDWVMLSAISPGLRIPRLSVSSSRLFRLLPSPESHEETMSGVSLATVLLALVLVKAAERRW